MKKYHFFYLIALLILFTSFKYREHYRNPENFKKEMSKCFYTKKTFLNKEILLPEIPSKVIEKLKPLSEKDLDLLPYLATAYIENIDIEKAEECYIKYFNKKHNLDSLSMLLDFYHKRQMYEKEVNYLLKGTKIKGLTTDEKSDIFDTALSISEKFLKEKRSLKREILLERAKTLMDFDSYKSLIDFFESRNNLKLSKIKKITSNRWVIAYAKLILLLKKNKKEDVFSSFYKNFDDGAPYTFKNYFFEVLHKKGKKFVNKIFSRKKIDFKDFSFLFNYLLTNYGNKKADKFLNFFIERKLFTGKNFKKDEKITLLRYSQKVKDANLSFRIINSLLLEKDLSKEEKINIDIALLDLFLNKK